VGIEPPRDVVLASTFDVELEQASGTIAIVIPYSTIEPIKQKLQTGFQVESDQTDKKLWTSIIKEHLLETDVDIKVNLGETEVKLKDLMNLKVGDVIPLTQDSSGELDVQVENVKKFKGYYGVHHGTVAMQITRQIEK
jgi:flagellar motor switch protein FliM